MRGGKVEEWHTSGTSRNARNAIALTQIAHQTKAGMTSREKSSIDFSTRD